MRWGRSSAGRCPLATRHLRSEAPDAASAIPALALTAFAGPEDRLRATSAGFQQYAAKPIDPRVLVRTVAALAAQRAAG